MPDLEMIRGNVKTMIQNGAPREDIDRYLELQGTSAQELRNSRLQPWTKEVPNAFPPTPTTPDQKAMEATTRAFDDLKQSAAPPPGTREDLPAFTGEGLKMGPTNAGLPTLAGMVTWDDKAYGDIIKKQLGDRLTKVEKDPNGYEIVSYRGDDGKEYVAYINKPGLDLSDVNRELSMAIPMVVSGFGSGALWRAMGAGLAARALGAGVVEAGTVLGQEKAAQEMGSQQPTDWLRAVLAGGGGMLFEGLSGPITKLWRGLLTSSGAVAGGKLSKEAEQRAIELGLDPAEMNERLAAAFQRDVSRGTDMEEVGAKYRTGEFEIPTTKGQRTKDPSQLGVEYELGQGYMGSEGSRVMKEFEKEQQRAIDRAVREGVGEKLAPRQAGQEPHTLGARIQEGVRKAKEAFKGEENRLWGEVGPLYPSRQGRDILYDQIDRALSAKGMLPSPNQTPAAHQILKMLEDYRENKLVRPPYKALSTPEQELPIDEVRRQIKGLAEGAAPGSYDKKVANEVYGAFNDWVDTMADQALLLGDPASAAALKVARGFTRESKELFSPAKGKAPAAKIINQILDPENMGSPGEVVSTLFGRGGPRAPTKRGVEQTLRHMKGALRTSGTDAWDDIRLAYWVKLAEDNKGNVLPPQKLKEAIDSAFHNQKGAIDIMFTPKEQKLMQRLSRALEDVTSEKPFSGGKTEALIGVDRKRGTNLPANFARVEANRQLFSKHNVLMSRIWGALAKKLKGDPMGVRTVAGESLAQKQVKQNVTERPSSPMIMPAGTIPTMEYLDE